jgi:hypothetical protein
MLMLMQPPYTITPMQSHSHNHICTITLAQFPLHNHWCHCNQHCVGTTTSSPLSHHITQSPTHHRHCNHYPSVTITHSITLTTTVTHSHPHNLHHLLTPTYPHLHNHLPVSNSHFTITTASQSSHHIIPTQPFPIHNPTASPLLNHHHSITTFYVLTSSSHWHTHAYTPTLMQPLLHSHPHTPSHHLNRYHTVTVTQSPQLTYTHVTQDIITIAPLH